MNLCGLLLHCPQSERVQSTVNALRAELVNVVNGLVGEGFPLQDPQVRELPQHDVQLVALGICARVVNLLQPRNRLPCDQSRQLCGIYTRSTCTARCSPNDLVCSPVSTLPAAVAIQGWLGRLEAMNEASSICACLKDLEVSYQ